MLAEKGKTMIDKTIRRPTSNKEHFHDLHIYELAELLYGFCTNGKRCYFCPLYEESCAGVDASVSDWVKWLDKPWEKGEKKNDN